MLPECGFVLGVAKGPSTTLVSLHPLLLFRRGVRTRLYWLPLANVDASNFPEIAAKLPNFANGPEFSANRPRLFVVTARMFCFEMSFTVSRFLLVSGHHI